eukprot:1159185-Pelagomonas_calceolata.AAC.14
MQRQAAFPESGASSHPPYPNYPFLVRSFMGGVAGKPVGFEIERNEFANISMIKSELLPAPHCGGILHCCRAFAIALWAGDCTSRVHTVAHSCAIEANPARSTQASAKFSPYVECSTTWMPFSCMALFRCKRYSILSGPAPNGGVDKRGIWQEGRYAELRERGLEMLC